MIKDGVLDVPVIGVAKSGWNLEQLRERARDGITKYGGGVDEAAFKKLCELMDYIDGDYADDQTYATVARQAGQGAVANALPGYPTHDVPGGGEGTGGSGMRQERARDH